MVLLFLYCDGVSKAEMIEVRRCSLASPLAGEPALKGLGSGL